ncbi:MAG: STAS domain-containing protein [Planctomycetota bacterium]
MARITIENSVLSNNVNMITLKGSLDAHAAEELRTFLGRLYENKKYNLIYDLSNIDYISSAGVAVILDSYNTATDNNGNVVILNPSKMARDVLNMIGVTQIVQCVNTKEEALKLF